MSAAKPEPVSRKRLLALLRSTSGLRGVLVAKELLDPPVALRSSDRRER